VQGHTEICRLLVDRGANVNHETKNQDTALSMAVWKQKPETAMFLVNRGANPNHIDKFGMYTAPHSLFAQSALCNTD
jgi:ankyrin repeat protein